MLENTTLSAALICMAIVNYTMCFVTVAKSTQLHAEYFLTLFLKKQKCLIFYLAHLALQDTSQQLQGHPYSRLS